MGAKNNGAVRGRATATSILGFNNKMVRKPKPPTRWEVEAQLQTPEGRGQDQRLMSHTNGAFYRAQLCSSEQ
ncbi:MAG: hypothetical protein AAB767_04520 [Patescibacteria group bacterium]